MKTAPAIVLLVASLIDITIYGAPCPSGKHWVLKSLLVVITFIVFLSGCVSNSVDPLKNKRSLELDTIENIKIGKTTKEEIQKLLGKPDHETDFEKLIHLDETGLTWAYDEGSFYERLSLFFEKGSNRVSSIVWGVSEKDPENKLAVALGRYRGIKWKPRSEQQTNPHVTPKECYFENHKKGISIVYSRTRKIVTAIAWWDPNRTPANQKKKNNGKDVSCVSGHCHQYDPSVLTWQEPPCKIPP